MVYLMMHSTQLRLHNVINGLRVKGHSDCKSENPLLQLQGLFFLTVAWDILYQPSQRQHNTYQGLC